jgi:hypothetical protein
MRHQHPTIEQSKDGNFPHPLAQPFIPQRLSSGWEAVLELPMSTEGVSHFSLATQKRPAPGGLYEENGVAARRSFRLADP